MCPRITVVETECCPRLHHRLQKEGLYLSRELRAAQQYPGEHAMGLAIGGGDRDSAPAQRLGFRHPGAGDLAEMRKGADQALPGVELFGWLALAAEVLGRVEFRLDRRYHPLGDFVLEYEDVGELAVVALGPNVGSGRGLDQLRGNAQTVAGSTHATFEDIVHAELTADLLYVDRTALVGEAAVARDDKEPPDLRQRGDDVLGHAVREKLLFRVAAHVLERQHRDRRLVGQRQGRERRLRRSSQKDAVDAYR